MDNSWDRPSTSPNQRRWSGGQGGFQDRGGFRERGDGFQDKGYQDRGYQDRGGGFRERGGGFQDRGGGSDRGRGRGGPMRSENPRAHQPGKPEGPYAHLNFDTPLQKRAIDCRNVLFRSALPLTEENINLHMKFDDELMWQRFQREVTNLVVGVADVASPEFLPSNQKMLLMVGYPGSGKSTIAKKLLTAQANMARVNQDEMKTRKACEHAAKIAFGKGQNVIVDRCNFDYLQRNVWLKLALEHGCTDVKCLLLNVPLEVCQARVMVRQDHPTLGPNAASASVVAGFGKMFVPPILDEGFTEIITVENDAEIEAAIEKIIAWSNTTVRTQSIPVETKLPPRNQTTAKTQSIPVETETAPKKPNNRQIPENNEKKEAPRNVNPWAVLMNPALESSTSSDDD